MNVPSKKMFYTFSLTLLKILHFLWALLSHCFCYCLRQLRRSSLISLVVLPWLPLGAGLIQNMIILSLTKNQRCNMPDVLTVWLTTHCKVSQVSLFRVTHRVAAFTGFLIISHNDTQERRLPELLNVTKIVVKICWKWKGISGGDQS